MSIAGRSSVRRFANVAIVVHLDDAAPVVRRAGSGRKRRRLKGARTVIRRAKAGHASVSTADPHGGDVGRKNCLVRTYLKGEGCRVVVVRWVASVVGIAIFARQFPAGPLAGRWLVLRRWQMPMCC